MVSDPLPAASLSETPAIVQATAPATALATAPASRILPQGGWRSLRHQPPWLFAILGGLGLLLIGVPVALRQPSETTATDSVNIEAERVLPVETLRVEPVTRYSVSRSFTGAIAAVRSSSVGFERSGTLVAMLVEEGDRLEKGQPLARINIANLETQRRQLLAQQAQAQAQLNDLLAGARREDIAAAEAAVRDLQEQLRLQNVQRARRESLYRQGAIAKEQLDEFTYGAASLQARIDQAKSNLLELRNGSRPQEIAAQRAVVQQLQASVDDIDVTIGKSEIAAPFAGVVAEKLADEGTVVGAGQPVLRISASAAPEARIGIPVEMVSQLAIGESLQASSGNEQYRAEVLSILPEVDAATRTQTVVLALEPEQLTRVTPGQTVQVNLTEAISAEGYWLPTSALTQGIRGLWNCFAVVPRQVTGEVKGEAIGEGEGEGAAGFVVEQQAVEIVHQEGDRVLVRGTLQPGTQVVASGTHRMVPGQPVAPVTAVSNFP